MHQEKLVYKGLLSNWDGRDMDYFSPPYVDEEPVMDVTISEGYEIEVEGYINDKETRDLRINFGENSRVIIYENHDAVILRYMHYVKDYTEIHTIPPDKKIKVIHNWMNPENYMIYRNTEYEGPVKDWSPIYIK